MMFIYLYYGLFVYSDLVDVMLLFFIIFFFSITDFFLEKLIGFYQRPSEKVIDLSVKSDDNSAISAEIQDSKIRLFLYCLQYVSVEFF
jgi:hypothetical protein